MCRRPAARRRVGAPALLALLAVVALAGCGRDEPGPTSSPATRPGSTAAATTTPGTAPASAPEAVPPVTPSVLPPVPDSGAPAPAPTTSAPGPRIESFVIAPTAGVTCQGPGQTSASMSWRVTGAAGVAFLVDGQDAGAAQAGFGADGDGAPLPVNFICDGDTHTVTLVATNEAGTSEAAVAVTTVPS